ncbi:PcfJ domain-containing protein, partial [Micromonospora provocatoris]
GRYANGATNIFVIRKRNKPNTPFFTVEIKNDVIHQNRGKRNCLPTKEVEAFIKQFEHVRLSSKKNKSTERKVAI